MSTNFDYSHFYFFYARMSTFAFVIYLVSIIIPVKNATLYLNECIESIISQSYSNWELIAVNDNSTDNTLEILNKFKNKDSRITILNNNGKGIIEALKTGYKRSKGELITRMDADDIMSENKIDDLASLLLKNGKKYIATGLIKYFSDSELGNGYIKYEKWLNKLCANQSNFSEIYKECSIPSPCWMLWREDFEAIGGFENDTYPEDYDLTFRMYKYGMKIVGTKNTLHYWRDSTTRASRNDENYADNRFLELKTGYFLDIDYDSTKKLILWGAGKKGKEIAKILSTKNINFKWVCNSPTKIGHSIYNVVLKNCATTDLDNSQIIIAVANDEEQNSIQKTISNFKNLNYFYFC